MTDSIVKAPMGVQLITAVQLRLAELGYYRLRADGLDGPGTSNAVIRFKGNNNLLARDFVGEITLGRLFSGDAKPWAPPTPQGDDPEWLTEARGLLGTREVSGSGDNPTIMGWARDLDQWYPGDDTAWCGLFVAHCMNKGAPNEPQDFNRLGAREWLKYGEASPKAHPVLGSVAVFWRTHPTNSWHGHVALTTGYNDTHIRCIGGNQSNNVTEAWFSRDRLLGFRVPEGYEGATAPRAPTGSLSTSEA